MVNQVVVEDFYVYVRDCFEYHLIKFPFGHSWISGSLFARAESVGLVVAGIILIMIDKIPLILPAPNISIDFHSQRRDVQGLGYKIILFQL